MESGPGGKTIGVDMGGTMVRSGRMDGEGVLEEYWEQPTPTDLAGQLTAPERAIEALITPDVEAIGVAIAGIVRGGILEFAGNLKPRAYDYASALARHFALPTIVRNDVQAAAAAEARFGAGRGSALSLYISIGTGIGGAVVERGGVLVGQGAAGEFGHMILDPESKLSCPGCDARGCWEMLASGAAMLAAAEHLALSGQSPMLAQVLHEEGSIDASALDACAEIGDVAAQRVISDAARMTALGIRNLASAFDPGIVILGGGVPFGSSQYWSGVQSAYRDFRLSWSRHEIVRAEFGVQAGVMGAAVL